MYQNSKNSENVKLRVKVFDKAVNDALPSVAVEYGVTNVDYPGCGLDHKSYVGDEWAGRSTLERTLPS